MIIHYLLISINNILIYYFLFQTPNSVENKPNFKSLLVGPCNTDMKLSIDSRDCVNSQAKYWFSLGPDNAKSPKYEKIDDCEPFIFNLMFSKPNT